MEEKKLSPWQEYKKRLGETRPWHMVTGEPKVTEDIAMHRYNICLLCPELIKLTKQCKQCGCVMTLKTHLEKATCPIGKW
jgi:hypothetical protein